MLASLALSLLIVSTDTLRWDTFNVNNKQQAAASVDTDIGVVNYELPEALGTLNITMPGHWVGARKEGLEALWIDNDSAGFKANLILRIFKLPKTSDSETLLDQAAEKYLSNAGVAPTRAVERVAGHRILSFDTEVEGYLLSQRTLILYAENDTNSYAITLSSSELRGSNSIDLSLIDITHP